ncbi:hypothetical protein Lalb_Chr23g0271301 [Lupinus albus]|uniref:Uncharacterized protein n=1 Tax=Lupinus albus TaxID=3870 RepID=A0A6A4N8E7_LUPAL|nr:hypothetical protein Lalb_Chr23g0271301 [Lupinus albus]
MHKVRPCQIHLTRAKQPQRLEWSITSTILAKDYIIRPTIINKGIPIRRYSWFTLITLAL